MAGIREQKKQQTRQAIETAAINLFSVKGFDATSIEEIATAAGIGKTTIYGYFATKDEIFLHYCDDKLIQAFDQLKQDQKQPMTLEDQLIGFFMLKFGFITKNKEFGRHLLREMIFPKEINDKAKQHDQRYFDILEEVFKAAQERGDIGPQHDLFIVSAHFFSLYLGLLAGWYNGYFNSLDEVESSMRTLFKQVFDGIS